MNWSKLSKQIPLNVQIKSKVFYDVLWAKDFELHGQVGKSEPNYRQITIKLDETPKETVLTYLHEVIHAISDTYDIGLTEQQVLKLEQSLNYILKQNNIFKEKP